MSKNEMIYNSLVESIRAGLVEGESIVEAFINAKEYQEYKDCSLFEVCLKYDISINRLNYDLMFRMDDTENNCLYGSVWDGLRSLKEELIDMIKDELKAAIDNGLLVDKMISDFREALKENEENTDAMIFIMEDIGNGFDMDEEEFRKLCDKVDSECERLGLYS